MKCESCDFKSKFLRDFETCEHCKQEICKECREEHYVECQKTKHNYPDAFSDFKNGKRLSYDEIKAYLEDAKKTLQESENHQHALYYTSCGNTLVVGIKHEDGECVFFVAENFKELTVGFDELSKIKF